MPQIPAKACYAHALKILKAEQLYKGPDLWLVSGVQIFQGRRVSIESSGWESGVV